MKEKLAKYIKENLIISKESKSIFGSLSKERALSKKKSFSKESALFEDECSAGSINTYIDNNKNENNFQKLLFKYIDDKDLKDSDVYNKVHIDRRLFSKIRNDNYHPSRDTIILLGLSLELSIDEFMELLESASYSLPKNNYYDLIIRFCFIEGIYDIKDVNDLLAMYNCKLFSY